MVLEKLYLQKLKSLLQSSYLYLFLLLITFLFGMIRYFLVNNGIYFIRNNKHVVGYVTDFKNKDGKLSITLKAEQDIIINYYKDLELKYGDYIEAEGVIYEPNNNTIPNNFNYKKYLNNKDIFYIMKANKVRDI